MEGAVRGFYCGTESIQGQANLAAVEAQKRTAVTANSVAVAMGVALMVVGQYYMTQINTLFSAKLLCYDIKHVIGKEGNIS